MKRFLPVLLLCLLFLAFSACALADEIVLTGETDNTFVLQPEGSSWGWSEDTLAEFYCEDWAALHQTHPGSESFTTKMLTGPLTEQPELKTFDLAGEGHFLIRADSELVPGDYTFELSVGLGDRKRNRFSLFMLLKFRHRKKPTTRKDSCSRSMKPLRWMLRTSA